MKPNVWNWAKVMATVVEIERREADLFRAAIRAMPPHGESVVTRLQDRIAQKEERVRAISEWTAKEGVELAPGTPAWQHLPVDPRLGDRDWDEAALLGAYSVLAKAAIEKLRAFRFFSYVAAEATDPETKALAESLAREQLIEAAALRDARREAWREEGRKLLRWRDLMAAFTDPASATDLTRAIGTRAADQIDELACGAVAVPGAASKLREAAKALRFTGGSKHGLPREIAEVVFSPLTARTAIDRARQLLQRLFDVSDLVAKETSNEEAMRLAQEAAGRSIKALEILGPHTDAD